MYGFGSVPVSKLLQVWCPHHRTTRRLIKLRLVIVPITIKVTNLQTEAGTFPEVKRIDRCLIHELRVHWFLYLTENLLTIPIQEYFTFVVGILRSPEQGCLSNTLKDVYVDEQSPCHLRHQSSRVVSSFHLLGLSD